MPSCFVISPIGEPGSEIRHRQDGFLREVIKPISEANGYQVERADDDKSPGIVTDRIVNKIIDADLVIADLHGHNPNVMYELAVRHATGKPLIQMAPSGERLPFDISGQNTIFYDPTVLGLQQWRNDLAQAIRSLGHTGDSANPVARAGLMRTLTAQSGSEGAVLSALLDEMQTVRAELQALHVNGHSRSRNSRILVTPDQYLCECIKVFLDGSTALSGNKFLVNAKDTTLTVTVLPSRMRGPVQNFVYEFQHEPQASLAQEVIRLKRDILRDLDDLEQEMLPATNSGRGQEMVPATKSGQDER